MALVRARRLPQLTLDLPPPSTTAPPLPPPAPTHPSTSSSSSSSVYCSEYRLSDFDKLAVLGSGNGGVVYKVRHRRTGGVFALKLLLASAGCGGSAAYSREAEIHRSADHHSIVRCHAVISSSNAVSLLLDFMDVGSLESLIGITAVTETAVSAVARQALSALTYLHYQKIAHRDVKPANFLLNSGGEIKIADFGVSKPMRRSLETCHSYVGTNAYMSPERFDPEAFGRIYDAYAGDIWGLGLTLMELFLGRFPLLAAGQRPDWAALMCAICFGESPAMPPECGASPEFKDFVNRCLQKEPSKRWSAAQLLNHPFVSAGGGSAESDRVIIRQQLLHRASRNNSAEV